MDYDRLRSKLAAEVKQLEAARSAFAARAWAALRGRGLRRSAETALFGGPQALAEDQAELAGRAARLRERLLIVYPDPAAAVPAAASAPAGVPGARRGSGQAALEARDVLDAVFDRWFETNLILEQVAELRARNELLEAKSAALGASEAAVHSGVWFRALTAAAQRAFKSGQAPARSHVQEHIAGPLRDEIATMAQRELLGWAEPWLRASAPLAPALDDRSARALLAVFRLAWSARAAADGRTRCVLISKPPQREQQQRASQG